MNNVNGAPGGVRVERRVLRIGDLEPANPLPTLGAPLESPYELTGDLPAEILSGSRYGYPQNLYPYRLQDGYGRARSERSLESVVLENERLRAVFLPELGGRLWELVDKQTGTNLVYTPSSIQFGNLALLGAWFAGGIEFNIGTRGHSPTTCSPLNAGIVNTPDGQQVLRMWEFERLREVVFQIDAWLPADSPVLYVAMRVRNPNDTDVPMYWWSNAAVPENAGSRVIAPARSAFATEYTRGVSRVDPTDDGGVDGTWPTNNRRARDFFFDIPGTEPPWILNADERGDGLAMLSTPQLRGRKLFVWGQGAGGRRWQRWLSPEGGEYAEIQAGLAQTQFQHLLMPARAEWRWVEAYGNARVDPSLAHAGWTAAVRHAGERVRALADERALQRAKDAAHTWSDVPPERIVTAGSGWGALESLRRRRHAMPWLEERGTPFPESAITAEQRPWLRLLNGEGFARSESFVKGTDWEALLEQGVTGAHALLHRAFMAHARGALTDARRLYSESLERTEDPSPAAGDRSAAAGDRSAAGANAHRGLALLDIAAEAVDDALMHYSAACALQPESAALLVEALTAFLAADRPQQALGLLREVGDAAAGTGRIRFLHALALARAGKTADAAALLEAGIEVADLREGETSLAALWRQVHPGEDVPVEYEFGMG